MLAVGCAVVWVMWPMARYPWRGITTGITFTLFLPGMDTLSTAMNVDSTMNSATLITAGVLSIIAGSHTHAAATYLYGLVLVMLMAFKLAVIDMSGQNFITRILSLLVVSAICFTLSVACSRLGAHLSSTSKKPEGSD